MCSREKRWVYLLHVYTILWINNSERVIVYILPWSKAYSEGLVAYWSDVVQWQVIIFQILLSRTEMGGKGPTQSSYQDFVSLYAIVNTMSVCTRIRRPYTNSKMAQVGLCNVHNDMSTSLLISCVARCGVARVIHRRASSYKSNATNCNRKLTGCDKKIRKLTCCDKKFDHWSNGRRAVHASERPLGNGNTQSQVLRVNATVSQHQSTHAVLVWIPMSSNIVHLRASSSDEETW